MRIVDPVFVNLCTFPGYEWRADIEISVLRLDLCTQWAMGNKFFKLKKNVDQLVQKKVKRVLSFGGAWSNHLLALAQSARLAGIQSVGVVRGDEGFDNELLARMRSLGMQHHFISRSDYQQRHDPDYCEHLCGLYGCDGWLPEGGANALAVQGCEDIAKIINKAFATTAPGVSRTADVSQRAGVSQIVTAVGTGATLAGIVRGCHSGQTVTGVQVVRDASVADNIDGWIGANACPAHWALIQGDGLESYARPSEQKMEFIINLHKHTGIPLDPIYTGPALSFVLNSDFLDSLASGERVVFIHTGGLAGASGFTSRLHQLEDLPAVASYFASVDTLIEQRSMLKPSN